MNISILTVSHSEVIAAAKNSGLSFMASVLYKSGFNVKQQNSVEVDPAVIESSIKIALAYSDCLIIAAQDQIDYSYVVKKTIGKIFEEEIKANTYAKNNLTLYYKNQNIPLPKDVLSYSQIPSSARAIINDMGPMQGFLLEKNDKIIFFLPLNEAELKNMFTSSVLPYLLDNSNKRNKTIIYKTFGLTQNEMLSLLKDLRKNKQKVNIICNENLLDGEIIINFPENTDSIVTDGICAAIYKRLNAFVYADSDVSLSECLINLLALKSSTLVCAEDATCGNFTKTFLSENNANKYLTESYITPADAAKCKILGVEEGLFAKTKPDPNEIVYQMALGALENSGCDFVLSTFAMESTLYLGLGTKEGIHIYSQKFSGTKQELICKFTGAAYFNLIKKIKKNDFDLTRSKV